MLSISRPMAAGRRRRTEFTAFLSHRFKSPEVNLYFHGMFVEVADALFEIDDPTTATNVTRLERVIRDSDAFVGIYTTSGQPGDDLSHEQLVKDSRYFRLECELAARSRRAWKRSSLISTSKCRRRRSNSASTVTKASS